MKGIKTIDLFLSKLEKRLNQSGGEIKFKVLNFGVPGANSTSARILLEDRGTAVKSTLSNGRPWCRSLAGSAGSLSGIQRC
ncbi:MAG: hypothetical protein JKX97_00670 [Candidatus Lindowbacteria bacterium]|nr:hypothetical protein [Candidatus Lindowbacteria bacterium]